MHGSVRNYLKLIDVLKERSIWWKEMFSLGQTVGANDKDNSEELRLSLLEKSRFIT